MFCFFHESLCYFVYIHLYSLICDNRMYGTTLIAYENMKKVRSSHSSISISCTEMSKTVFPCQYR